MDLKDLWALIIGGLVAVISWALKQKDEAQGRQITALWTKHDEDAKALAELKERIAREHYLKHELDSRFESLELSFREGMRDLGGKMDKLTETLIQTLERKVDRGECERFHK